MSTSPFQLLYLGEDLAWSRLSQALSAAPRSSIKVHRAQSLNELFLVLAGGKWHAVAVDVHAWNFQGLHYVDKIRSEYPAFPILALCSSSVNDLDSKARNVGASQCLSLELLTGDTLFTVLVNILASQHSPLTLQKDVPVQVNYTLLDQASNRNREISHALNNLLCVITANADILSDHLTGDSYGERSLTEIKKAAKSASDLMRHLK